MAATDVAKAMSVKKDRKEPRKDLTADERRYTQIRMTCRTCRTPFWSDHHQRTKDNVSILTVSLAGTVIGAQRQICVYLRLSLSAVLAFFAIFCGYPIPLFLCGFA
jgi:hypothetical protein